MVDYLSGLNDRQREAVLHKDGPIMIVAGARQFTNFKIKKTIYIDNQLVINLYTKL